jgi:N-methylhydantoinase B
VFLCLVQAMPDEVTAAPAGTSGNFALGGFDPARGAGYVMYQITGGGYGGNAREDGLTNGCSTIGISKTAPVEVMEQYYPVLFRRFALREGSGGAGRIAAASACITRWSCCAARRAPLRHGPWPLRPARRARRRRRRAERRALHRGGHDHPGASVEGPGHRAGAGDRVEVMTPGGGGYGDPARARPALVARDVRARLLRCGTGRRAVGRGAARRRYGCDRGAAPGPRA